MDTKNKNESKDHRPIKFIDQVERNKHILLFVRQLKICILVKNMHTG